MPIPFLACSKRSAHTTWAHNIVYTSPKPLLLLQENNVCTHNTLRGRPLLQLREHTLVGVVWHVRHRTCLVQPFRAVSNLTSHDAVDAAGPRPLDAGLMRFSWKPTLTPEWNSLQKLNCGNITIFPPQPLPPSTAASRRVFTRSNLHPDHFHSGRPRQMSQRPRTTEATITSGRRQRSPPCPHVRVQGITPPPRSASPDG